jgi:hypothetical protein
MPVQWRIAGAADFNGDGFADLVWENTATGERAIWFLKNGVFSSGICLPTIPVQWHIGITKLKERKRPADFRQLTQCIPAGRRRCRTKNARPHARSASDAVRLHR